MPMPDDPNDLFAPPPTPEDLARFAATVAALDGEMNDRFGGQMATTTMLLTMGNYADHYFRAHGYDFACRALVAGWSEHGRNMTIDLEPRTLHAGRLYILWRETTGAREVSW